MFDQVEANYDQLDQVSSQFANQADAVQQMLQQVRASLSQLENGGWIGDAADAFFAEMNQVVLPATWRLQNALEEGSQATKDISQTFQQAEEEASNPFKS